MSRQSVRAKGYKFETDSDSESQDIQSETWRRISEGKQEELKETKEPKFTVFMLIITNIAIGGADFRRELQN